MANKDTLIKMFEGIRDERTKHANTARRIGNAFLSMLDFASSAGDGKLSSVHDDIAQGFITFVKGLMVNQLAQLKGGASFGSDGLYSFDKDGNLVIESAHSRDFDEVLQNGFALKRNPTSGKYTLSISDLIVWGRMVINTLEIRKKYAIGGNVYLSGASSKIRHVEKVYSEDGETVVGYKCYILKDDGTMATQNNWVVGDQALCQTFDIEEGVYQNVSNQYYWRLVTQVSEENVAITEKYTDKDGNEQIRELYEGQKFAWVVLSKDDCDTNSGIPASGDTIVLDGHRLTENEDTDYTERTNVLMLEATGSGSPRIIALTGVVDYKHTTDNEVFILSPRKVIFTTEHFEIRTAAGAPITFVHFMGPWVKDTEYHYYDQVSHANALWTCIVEKGKSTTDEPTDGSTYWRKEMSGGKGEKGDDAVSYTLEASPGYIRLSSDGSIDYTNGYIDKGDEYGSDKYLVVRGYKVAKGVRDNRFSTEENPVTLRLTINDGSAYSEYTPSDGDSVSIDFEPKYEDSYYSMLQEISHSGLNSVRVDLCEGSEYNTNKILATLDIPITQSGKDGQKGDDAVSYNINFVTHKDDVHNDTILYVYVVRSVGKESTSTLISNIPEISETTGLEVRVYCDGDYNENLTNHVKWSGSIQRSAWETVKNFEVRLYLNDKLVTSNSYSYGEQGTDGKDAISILVEDAPLVFDTDDSGTVPVSVTKTAKVKVMKGNTNVTNDCTSESSRDDLSSNCMSSVKKDKDNECINVSIQGNWISKNDVIVDGVNQGQVSATSGYAVAQFVYAGVVYFAQVPFSVNVAKFTGVVAFNNKQYESKFEEISTRFKNTPTNKDLTDAESRITQTARKISLSVSEKSVGRRNLLAGSAFNRQEGFSLLLDANIRGYGILMNDGVDGMNCIRVASYYDTNRYQYCGAFWGGYNTKNIRIKHGTQYTFSCWVKVDEADTTVYLEVIYNRAEIGQDGDGRPTGAYSFCIKEPNKWQLVKWSFTTDDTHEWIEANVFTSSDVAYRTFVARFCKPMLEEGDYNGWTLSTEDYDYIGGNMLDNTLSLDKSGTLYDVNGTLTPLGFGESTSIYKSFAYKLKGTVYSFSQLPSSGNVYGDTYYVSNTETCYRYNGSEFENVGNDYYYNVLEWRKGKAGVFEAFGLEANKDYVFSFMAKGTGKLTAYFYSPDTNVFVESSLGYTANTVNAQADFGLTSDWKKYWVHWRPSDSSHKYVLLRLNRTIQSSAGDAPITDCYIAQPKLEAGAVVTEYTERKSDLVDKASLKAAGIVVDSESVTLYGSQVHIKNNKNDTNDTVLIDNNTGKVSAGLINAERVVAEGIKTQELEAQNLKVTGNSQLGIFQIKTSSDDDKRDNYTVAGDMITYSGSYKFPDGKTDLVSYDHFTYLTYKPLFIRQGSADRGKYMRLGDCYTEWDDCGFGFDNSYLFNGASARYVCGGVESECKKYVLPTNLTYSTNFFPVSYIYSTKSSKNDPAFAINIQSSGTAGERTAIQTNAAIRGVLAPNAISINDTRTIPNGIGVVICTNGSDMTLTLPANPVEGQTLIIIQGSTSKVYIVPPKGDTIYWGGRTRYDTGNRFYSETIGQFTILVFIRGAWQLQFMNTHP